jgi:hypothetical protein
MRRLPAAAPRLFVSSSRVLAVALSISLLALFEQFQAEALPAGTLHAPICESENATVFRSNELSMSDLSCPMLPRPSIALTEARAYLVETASPGYTMIRQGPELAIERLNPEFAMRLAGALRDARESGLPSAGIFSAYRPPAFGVGGFADKFNSLHAYGLAVDLVGIGGPGSLDAKRWHEIAATHGVICPYGPGNRAEWNHCQPTSLKAVMADSPLRDAITAQGPLSLESMFEAGNLVIQSSANIDDAVGQDGPVHARPRRMSAKSRSRTARGSAAAHGGA